MKTALKFLLCAAASAVTVSADAKGEDLVNCTFSNGVPMTQKVCVHMRKIAERDARQEEERQAAVERDHEQRAAVQAQESAAADQAAIRRAQEQAAIQAHTEALQREEVARQKTNAKVAKAKAEREADRKAACGGDYKNPRIGMAIERAQECVGALKLRAQVNQADGVVSTYEGSGMVARVIDGKVVGWAR